MDKQAVVFEIVGVKQELNQAAVSAVANLLLQLVDDLAKDHAGYSKKAASANETLNEIPPTGSAATGTGFKVEGR